MEGRQRQERRSAALSQAKVMAISITNSIYLQRAIHCMNTFYIGMSYLGQRVKVQFDDGKEYLGVTKIHQLPIGSQSLRMEQKIKLQTLLQTKTIHYYKYRSHTSTVDSHDLYNYMRSYKHQ